MKLDRLLSILILLLRNDRLQAKDLAARFEVSVRTILRDVETINLAGIPVVTYQGANGGIGLAEGYRLDRSMLTADEMVAIITSLQGMAKVIPQGRPEILLEKLKNILSLSQLEKVELKSRQLIIDPLPWLNKAEIQSKLTTLKQAVEESKKVQFRYLDAAGKETERTVEPYYLIMKGQNWYLYAFCLLRQDFRFFKLSRLKELAVKDDVFTPQAIPEESINPDQEWRINGRLVTLELIFEQEMKTLVREWFGDDSSEREDGRILVKTVLPENNWLYGFLLSFGRGIEVVSPPHLRSIVAEIAEQIYQKHST